MNRKSKFLIKSILICLVLICSMFFISNIIFEKEKPIYKNDTKEKLNNLFAIRVEQSDGTYADENKIPTKEDGYIFNSNLSGCIDSSGRVLENSLEYRNNMIRATLSNTSACYLYFDKMTDGDFCIEQDIIGFSDCLLVMDNYSLTPERARNSIKSKGDATTSVTSPNYTFEKSIQTNVTNDGSVVPLRTSYTVAKSYKFNAETGVYTLSNDADLMTVTDSHIGYYTCLGLYYCSTLYKINSINHLNDGTQLLTNVDIYSQNSISTFESENGLYATTDDDGTSYFYRGNVTNNYVSFGGFIWRVVRINGDGSIRMIYAGTSATETGVDDQISTGNYALYGHNPQYTGYKYIESNLKVLESTEDTEVNLAESRLYWFATSYTETNGEFKLSGSKIQTTFEDLYSDGKMEQYPYTFFSTDSAAVRLNLKKITGYKNVKNAIIRYISAVPTSYTAILANEVDSPIKTTVETWYENNILNAKDSNGDYLIDFIYQNAAFCNDRTLYSGSGYLMSHRTDYSIKNRLDNLKKPSLLCSQSADVFKVSNGNLKYPIGLITADEVSFAGINKGMINQNNYLYTGQEYWTMTPSEYSSYYTSARVYTVDNVGTLLVFRDVNSTLPGIRPVINIKSNIKIASGNGTASNPYILKLN